MRFFSRLHPQGPARSGQNAHYNPIPAMPGCFEQEGRCGFLVRGGRRSPGGFNSTPGICYHFLRIHMLQSILTYGTTVPMLLCFSLIFVCLHPLFIAAGFFGKADSVMYLLNFLTNRSLMYISGMRYSFHGRKDLPVGRPIIVVSNHQSMFDISLAYEAFAGHRLGFIAKIELGRGVPSVSWVLRNLGAALIKRDDARQSLSEIRRFGEQVEQERRAVLIFPEGTRARDGAMKKFLASGIMALLKAVPSALIVPVVIDGSWELVRYGCRPVPYGVRVTFKMLEPVEPSEWNLKELPGVLEERIRSELEALRGTRSVQAEAPGCRPKEDACRSSR